MNTTYELTNPGRCLDQSPAAQPEHLERPELALRRIVGAISRWQRRRAAIRELRALDDYHLMDIGLERFQIVSAVEEMIENENRPA
ncbi:DUF1127 domain-containing protein [Pelagibius sp. Alg239-R121]|uniref:DUF1127 domain-containing protein n=1 Tax=Pelagibius sp. Alg239-R121 TaxID=2993448 RepID=UPI0024A68BDA|nr:DUF1127 domain-containing protein [Pelagibius sp. Alg239-R121]